MPQGSKLDHCGNGANNAHCKTWEKKRGALKHGLSLDYPPDLRLLVQPRFSDASPKTAGNANKNEALMVRMRAEAKATLFSWEMVCSTGGVGGGGYWSLQKWFGRVTLQV